MVDNTSNYSMNRVIGAFKNLAFLNKSDSSTNQQIDFTFKVDPDARILKVQATTFSNNYRAHGYVNLQKILRCSDRMVDKWLYETYIYSYLKCFHNAIFSGVLDNESDFGLCFHGHSKFYHLIRQNNYSILKDEVFLSCNIDHGDFTERRIKMAMLVKQFSFLKRYSNYISGFGLQPFYIPEYEEKLSYLKEDYYANRADGEPAQAKEDLSTEKNTSTFDVAKEALGKGTINIVRVRNNECQSIMTQSQLVLTNTFYSESRKEFYYIDVNDKYKPKDNTSFFFPLANFICITSKCDVAFITSNFYRSFKITPKEDFFAASEVYTNTGIRCAYVPMNFNDPYTKDDPLGGVDPELILSKLKEFPDRLNEVISIFELIEEIIESFKIKVTEETDTKVKIETETKEKDGKPEGK